MISNLFKKMISIITILSLLLPMTPVLAKSESDVQAVLRNQQELIAEIQSISNIQIEPNSTLQNMEYTYIDKAGKAVKVIEEANDDLSYVKSQVYTKNETGEYILEYTTITEVGEDSILVTKYENGKTTQNSIDLKPIKASSKQHTQDIGINSEPPISGWELHDTVKYSYRIYTYTVVAVIAVVTGVASAANNAVIAGLAYVVDKIIDDLIPQVWYTQYWHRKWRKWPTLWELVAERNTTYHYSNSSRTNLIGQTTSEHWL